MLLAHESLVLLIAGDGRVLAICNPLDEASIKQVVQGSIHRLLVQDLVLNLFVGSVLLNDLVLELLHLLLHGCMLLQLEVNLCLLELLLELVFLYLLPCPTTFGIGYMINTNE